MLTATYNFFQKVIEKSDFPKIKDVNIELNKLNLLRIILGVVVFIRSFKIAVTAIYYFVEIEPIIASFVALVGAFFIIVGFFTPITLLCVILFYARCDEYLSCSNLGTDIFVLMSLVFLFTGTGIKYSVDGYIIRRFPNSWLAVFLRSIYNIFKFPKLRTQLNSIYFLAFLSFALISFGAMMYHSRDPFWMSGHTNHIVFTSAYLSSKYWIFRYIEYISPSFIFFLSAISIIGQSIFQLFMIPLMFFRLGRWYVIIWGLIFFTLSIFVLQLSYLPWLELIMWTILFYRPTPKRKIGLLYDDFSSFHKKIISLLNFINFNKRLSFLPQSTSKKWIDKYKLENANIEEIHVLQHSKVYKGYEAYTMIARVNPILWIFIPFLYLANIMNLYKMMYGFIKSIKAKSFEKLEKSFRPIKVSDTHYYYSKQKKSITKIIVLSWILLHLFFISFFPIVEDYTSKKIFSNETKYTILAQIRFHTGFVIPIVFNPLTLGLGQYWNVIYRENPTNSKEEMIPFHGLEGERLSYLSSDIMYFGNSLQYRRGLVVDQNKDSFHTYHQPGNAGFYYIQNIVRFDYLYTGQQDEVIYKYDIVRNNLIYYEIPLKDRYSKKIIKSGKLKLSKNEKGQVVIEIINI